MKKRNAALQRAIKNHPKKGIGLAEDMGVTWQTLYQWGNPPAKYIKKLAKISGIPEVEFLP